MAVHELGIQLLIRLKWKISKFSEISKGTVLKSSEFVFSTGHKMCLSVYKDHSDIHRFYIDSLNAATSHFLVHWEFRFIDRLGRERFAEMRTVSFEEGDQWKLIKELDFKKVRSDLLVQDILTISCVLSLEADSNVLQKEQSSFRGRPRNVTQQGIKTEEANSSDSRYKALRTQEPRRKTEGTQYDSAVSVMKGSRRKVQNRGTQTGESHSSEADPTKSLRTLSFDYERLFNDRIHTDSLLKAGDDVFPIHRAVLSARSSVFAAMFRLETTENKVEMQDVNAAIFSNVLYYVYCGKIRGLTADTAASMFSAADKYTLLELREECLQFLLHNLTVSNICEAALLSHTHEESVLETRVVSFIDGSIKQVLDSNGWQDFFAAKPLIAVKFLLAAYLDCKTRENVEHPVTMSNVCESALLAHTHEDAVLENRVVGFIDGNIKQVLDSDQWKDFFAAKPLIAGKFLSAAYLACKVRKKEEPAVKRMKK